MKSHACIVLLFLGAVASRDQVDAQTSAAPTLYRLDQASSFEQGCFPPCLCPVMVGEPVKGTFLLTPIGYDGLFSTYQVTNLNWVVSLNGTNLIVTGSGTYKVGGEVALLQELSLDLQVGADQVEHFDSGLVPDVTPFPNIKVDISIHGEVCFDTVFSVSASPVPLDQILPYQLLTTSTFAQGCIGPCECPDGPPEPIVGTFDLVPLEGTSVSREFAVINARWFAFAAAGSIPVQGVGVYRIDGSLSSKQQLNLVLTVGEGTPVRFDSGVVPGDDSFPLVDIGISVSGAVCFNTWIDLHSEPMTLRPAKATPAGVSRSE